jgi:SAM-dependent methyltransferase
MTDRMALYSVERVPVLQNRVFATTAEARDCVRGDVRLVQDPTTGLVFNEAFDASLVKYDRHYNNEQGLSPAFDRHLDDVARIVLEWLGTTDLLEVGCGKAAFLERLAARGCRIEGCDPTYEGSSPHVIRAFYGRDLGYRGKNIVLRHVLEHIPDPVGFLQMVADANGGGRIYIEVPCFDWILAHRAWFDIFYEHVNYFRLTDLERMFGTVHASGRIFGGQYLYVVAELATVRPPRSADAPIDFPPDFLGTLAGPCLSPDDVIWGAASKGVIYALLRERLGCPAAVAVDVNPAKQGMHLPGTGLEILSPEHCLARIPPGRRVCVMNSNYLDEIRDMTTDRYTYEAIDDA